MGGESGCSRQRRVQDMTACPPTSVIGVEGSVVVSVAVGSGGQCGCGAVLEFLKSFISGPRLVHSCLQPDHASLLLSEVCCVLLLCKCFHLLPLPSASKNMKCTLESISSVGKDVTYL